MTVTVEVVRPEPSVRFSTSQYGWVSHSVEQARELHAKLGEVLREIDHEGVRLRVTWDDGAVRDALNALCLVRDEGFRSYPRHDSLRIAIDCLRAVLGDA